MPYSEKQLAAHREIMTQGEALPVVLVARQGKRSRGVVRLLRMSEEQRGSRARRFLLRGLGLSLVAAICPPHILWLTLGLVTSVVGYFWMGRQTERLLGGEADCPGCGARQLIPAEPVEFPFLHFCSACGLRCSVERAASQSD